MAAFMCEDPVHQQIVMDPVEETLQIQVHYPAVAPKHMSLRRSYRLMGIAPRTKAVTVLGEQGNAPPTRGWPCSALQ